MRQGIKMVRNSPSKRQSRDSQSADLSVFSRRLWKVLVVLAVPFVVICANYFEALERTGVPGAYIADMLLPVVIIGYIVLIFVLKKREI